MPAFQFMSWLLPLLVQLPSNGLEEQQRMGAVWVGATQVKLLAPSLSPGPALAITATWE